MLAVYGPARPQAAPVIGEVVPTLADHRSPAARAGLVTGDRVLTATIAGRTRPVQSWDGLVRIISAHAGDPLTLTVRREARTRQVTLTPIRDHGRGRVGIAQAVVRRPEPLPQAMGNAVSTTGRAVAATYVGIARLVGGLGGYVGGLGHPGSISGDHRMISVVGASNLAESAAQHGLAELLALIAMINIAVAAFNLLPVLPFDGGHIVVAAVERLLSLLRRRETTVSPVLLTAMSAVVLVLVLGLGLSAIYLDLVAPIRL
jgi:membrane-associated protease RseP (regulator of RpoE activity)